MKYPLLTYQEVKYYIPFMQSLGVSKRARSKGQFLDTYQKYHNNLPESWALKRENFIKRHYEQYKVNPTVRRRLALIAWAFDPEHHSYKS